ncbi:hypothetical protein TNCV_1269501 [Trichonephila clavipes]|nr:hypothetical protein TNCV_1269501 [Trichonephila clavipes]
MVKRLWLIQHRPMTLHSLTENSLAVLKSQDLWKSQFTGPKAREIRLVTKRSLSINRLWHELCDHVAPSCWNPQLLDIMIVQFRGMKKLVIMALYRSPLTVTLWPSSFLKKDSTSAHRSAPNSQFFWM